MARRAGIRFEDLIEGSLPIQEASPWQRHELEFESLKTFRPLQTLRGLRLKKMFGGLALYRGSSLTLILMNDTETHSWKQKTFDFPLWNGVLIATDRPYHTRLKKISTALMPHPVLGKWLYLPRKTLRWNSICKKLITLVQTRSPLIGVKSRKAR